MFGISSGIRKGQCESKTPCWDRKQQNAQRLKGHVKKAKEAPCLHVGQTKH